MPIGDEIEQRYEALVRTHLDTIRNLCWKASGGDEFVFAEMVQTCFIHLWKSFPLFDPSYGPHQQRLWVKGRCRGAISRFLRQGRKRFLPLDDDIPEAVDENNLRETLEELSEGLTLREREVLGLLLEGRKVSEIATLLGVKARSVSQTRQRIIQRMKNNCKRLYL